MSLAVKVARAGSQGGVGPSRQVGGDPGIFGFLGRGIKSGLGLAARLTGVAPIQQRATIPTARILQAPAGRDLPGPRARAQRFFPGGETGVGIGCPKGHRPNKSDYFLRDGTFIEAGSVCVKIRRRNPMNARALSRAIGRVDGGKRLQHRLAQIETGKFTKAGNRKDCKA